MPELDRFDGIVIHIYYLDHERPHFHAKYAEHRVKIAINDNFDVLAGELPRAPMRKVIQWAAEHRKRLQECWDVAAAGKEMP